MVYRSFRNRLGRAIILGLELLVAADILRTISSQPTLQQVVVLGIVVLIRTFLSFSLEIELEGRWPWQGSREAVGGAMSDAPLDLGSSGPRADRPGRRSHADGGGSHA